MEIPLSQRDLKRIAEHGLTPGRVREQFERIRRGFPPLELERPCTPKDGVSVWTGRTVSEKRRIFEERARSKRIVKFVPASGAATRMFQPLVTAYGSNNDSCAPGAERGFLSAFFERLEEFPFYPELEKRFRDAGKSLELVRKPEGGREILECLLEAGGMNLKNLPKALIPFHRLGNHALVPLEEHFRESIHYLRTGDRTTRIHFTVLPEHEKGFRECFESIRLPYEQAGCPLEMELSRQDPSTDAVALDLSGNPLRDSRGDLVFRPSGHGALLNNLEKAAERCDIAFVKNIDNVLPDALKSETILYAKALTGTLIELEQEVHHALARLDPESGDSPPYADILELARDRFGTPVPRRWADFSREERRGFLRDALDRPLRVCALVPARGETGGLPFWVREEDGRLASQIVESAQMDLENPAVRDMVQNATHFNPVFMALALKNREGKPFSLSRFAEPRAGIVTKKNHDRLECRALEAPGLWNGGMHHWNTLFVEAPREIFAPVKTVMDLLNDQHRGRS